MRDQRLGQLDRQARQGDAGAARRRLVERLRRGHLDEARLRLAAYLGDPGAQVLLGAAAPAPPDPATLPGVLRDEVLYPARSLAHGLRGHASLPAGSLRPTEFLEGVRGLAVDDVRAGRQLLGWVDAFHSGLGLPRASDSIGLGLWLRHLPPVDRTVRTRAALAAAMRAWQAWGEETLRRHGAKLTAGLAAMARWTQAPSGGRQALAQAVLASLPPAACFASGAEMVLALSYRLLPATFDAQPGSRPFELLLWRVADVLCPPEREPAVPLDAETPLSHAVWIRLCAGAEQRAAIQHAIRAVLLPWAVGETDPLADWLAGRPLPLAWAPPPLPAGRSTGS